MSTDRELLEWAAVAIGWRVFKEGERWGDDDVGWFFNQVGGGTPALYCTERPARWAPLTDDGDALRLAVMLSSLPGGVCLQLNSRFGSTGFAQTFTNENVVSPMEYMEADPYAAARRSVVRAAAEIGKAAGTTPLGDGEGAR